VRSNRKYEASKERETEEGIQRRRKNCRTDLEKIEGDAALSDCELKAHAAREDTGDMDAEQSQREPMKPICDSCFAREQTPIAGLPFLDLLREGPIGLMKAVDKFEIGAGPSSRGRNVVDPPGDHACYRGPGQDDSVFLCTHDRKPSNKLIAPLVNWCKSWARGERRDCAAHGIPVAKCDRFLRVAGTDSR